VGAMNYYNPAYIALVLASIGVVAMPVHLTSYRERRVLRRLRASSLSIWTVLGSQVVVTFAIAILGSILLTILSMIVYHTGLPKMWGPLIPAFILGTLMFASIGMFLGAVLPNTRAAQGLGLILFFVMMILGGAGPPREVMTQAMRYVSNSTPMWHVILLFQEPWLGFGSGWNWPAAIVAISITVVSTTLAAVFFHWE
jgi:ABC-2 type transport system permease protein